MKYYALNPIKLGCEVFDINLQTENRPEAFEDIKKDVHTHRLLVFRNQGIITGNRHVEISSFFGDLESTFYQHEKSPHPHVFRVSNDRKEGCTGVGRTGWHIDGSFQPAPFAYSLYHMVSVPSKGNTVFVPLNEVVESLPAKKRREWERLWMVSDRQSGPVHPLIYPHPVTGKKTMCFHLGMTDGYIWDKGTADEQLATPEEIKRINQEIYDEIVKDKGRLLYSHKWEEGDFIISDNLAVGHEAAPETQYPKNVVGLRVLHRTTVKGIFVPRK